MSSSPCATSTDGPVPSCGLHLAPTLALSSLSADILAADKECALKADKESCTPGMWQTASRSGTSRSRSRVNREVCAMAISPDGQFMAISPDRRYLTADGEPTDPIHLIRLVDGTELRQIDPGERLHVLAFSRDGTQLLSGGEDNAARVWDVATGRSLGEPIKHRSWVETVAFTADGRTAASAGQDSVIRIWDVNTTKELTAAASAPVLALGCGAVA